MQLLAQAEILPAISIGTQLLCRLQLANLAYQADFHTKQRKMTGAGEQDEMDCHHSPESAFATAC